MSKSVVDQFKVIDVAQQDTQGLSRTCACFSIMLAEQLIGSQTVPDTC